MNNISKGVGGGGSIVKDKIEKVPRGIQEKVQISIFSYEEMPWLT